MTGERSFAYHRSLAPMLWVLMGLSAVELGVVHLLVALLWSGRVALCLSVVTLAAIAWLFVAIRSFRRLPVLVDGERVLMRAGIIRCVAVPRDRIVGLRGEIGAAEARARDVFNLALTAHPNMVLDLAPPLTRSRRQIRTVAHRLDDPAAFAAALADGVR